MSGDDLRIDLSDPEDVATKMPELRCLYEEKLQEQKALNEQVELLRRLVGGAVGILWDASQVPAAAQVESSTQVRRRRAAPAQERAVRALQEAGTAMGPTSLYKFMLAKGVDVPKDANVLGANLWDAWKAGRIMRAPNGVYTPLDGTGRTEWDRPLTDYYYAAEQGFPCPAVGLDQGGTGSS